MGRAVVVVAVLAVLALLVFATSSGFKRWADDVREGGGSMSQKTMRLMAMVVLIALVVFVSTNAMGAN